MTSLVQSEDSPETEKMSTLKQLLLAQEDGLTVDYRCIKCHDCWSCKNADETEKLSLREEQENQLIKDSVDLNFEANAIECTLPVRGIEREFLSSNKEIAIKVIASVAKRYQGDDKARHLVLESFKKLFDKGYLNLMGQLTPEEKKKVESKEVQYFIPWRPVFSDSVTTPCRITMDASSRTKKRPDGSGGRCLNDYVVKGTVKHMNLLQLVLRWLIGLYGFTCDIAQMQATKPTVEPAKIALA